MSPLLFIILTPVIAALFVMAGSPARRTSLFAAILNLFAVGWLFASYDREIGGYQALGSFPIVPSIGLNFTLGADGLSFAMLFLAALVTVCAVWVTPVIEKGEHLFYSGVLFISAGVIGAFSAIDLFFFYAFHELALIPTFLLIGVWGSGDRQAAAWKVTIYLALGSFVLLIGLIGLYFSFPEGSRTFDIRVLQTLAQDGGFSPAPWVYLTVVIGFGVLVSLFPFHSWAPQAYASAPTAVAMLHAGVLKKFGLYGLLRLSGPVFGEAAAVWADWLLVLLLGNILYLGFVTIAQKKLDWMLGYSSVMHMGYIFLGVAGASLLSLSGAAVLMFAHGLSIAALFALCGELRNRVPTLEIAKLGGLAKQMPVMGLLFGFAAMASIGLPGFANFPGEAMVFFGAFARGQSLGGFNFFQVATVLAVWGVVISAVYMLRAYRHIFMGVPHHELAGLKDLSMQGRVAVLLLLAALMVVGFYPQLLVRYVGPAVFWP